MLQMIADDHSYGFVAAKLDTSEQVIKNEMSFTIRELQCSSRTGAACEALRKGWIE
jgi:DNA-binding NarL/FixJ family response regulator